MKDRYAQTPPTLQLPCRLLTLLAMRWITLDSIATAAAGWLWPTSISSRSFCAIIRQIKRRWGEPRNETNKAYYTHHAMAFEGMEVYLVLKQQYIGRSLGVRCETAAHRRIIEEFISWYSNVGKRHGSAILGFNGQCISIYRFEVL